MKSKYFKNYDQIATTKPRQDILSIAAAGLDAIDTAAAIKNNIRVTDHRLQIKDQSFDLTKFQNIKVIGFGKASCTAALALEEVLGSQLKSGITLGLAPVACEIIQTFGGTHPQPSELNVQISEQIMKLSEAATADDLVLVVVSGGGSALLCYPQQECDQGQILYHQFLKTGGTIEELNTIRKHISQLKGGGLAKELYPATVVGLIFSDVPGDDYAAVASGPTYLDATTMQDAQNIIAKYNLTQFELNETPKEQKYFEKVVNIPLVSNQTALDAMQKQAETLGLKAKVLANNCYDAPKLIIEKMQAALSDTDVVLVGGEPRTRGVDGTGGRNLFSSLQALTQIRDQEYFFSLASDGLDNSDAAGAIADSETKNQAKALGLDAETYLKNFDSYTFFKAINQLIFTGTTNANVSDLLILLKTK